MCREPREPFAESYAVRPTCSPWTYKWISGVTAWMIVSLDRALHNVPDGPRPYIDRS